MRASSSSLARSSALALHSFFRILRATSRIEIQVDGLVDRAHPSFAQQFQQPIIIKLAVGTQALPTTRATDLR